VREFFAKKYTQRERKPYLVLVDTMAAFGKSAIYNRLKEWKFVGYTEGKTTLHLTANGAYRLIASFMQEYMPETWRKNRFGDGPNWRIRVLRKFFKLVGFSDKEFEDLLFVGRKRAYYVCPHAWNWKEFLNAVDPEPGFCDRSFEELAEEWKRKWMKIPEEGVYAVD